MNCLMYQYWYQSKFFNWLSVFLEKVQTNITNQNFIICYWYFSWCYLFLSLWHCSHVFVLPIAWWWFNFCGALGLLLCLKSKKQKGMTHFFVWWGVTISPTCMRQVLLCQNFWVNGQKFGLEGSLKMMLSMRDK